MRNILILLLAAAVVWLFMERVRLSDELAAAKKELGASSEGEVATGGSGIGGGPGAKSGSKSGWLDKHIDSGARSLDAPKPGRH